MLNFSASLEANLKIDSTKRDIYCYVNGITEWSVEVEDMYILLYAVPILARVVTIWTGPGVVVARGCVINLNRFTHLTDFAKYRTTRNTDYTLK